VLPLLVPLQDEEGFQIAYDTLRRTLLTPGASAHWYDKAGEDPSPAMHSSYQKRGPSTLWKLEDGGLEPQPLQCWARQA